MERQVAEAHIGVNERLVGLLAAGIRERHDFQLSSGLSFAENEDTDSEIVIINEAQTGREGGWGAEAFDLGATNHILVERGSGFKIADDDTKIGCGCGEDGLLSCLGWSECEAGGLNEEGTRQKGAFKKRMKWVLGHPWTLAQRAAVSIPKR